MPGDPRLQRAINLVVLANRSPVTVTDLARAAGLSVSYFAHLFHREHGVSPARFLEERRIREAEALIRSTNLPLKEILGRLGVSDRSHFIRTFKRRFGLTPFKYRAEARHRDNAPAEPM